MISNEQLKEIRKVVKKFLTKDASERLARIRLVKPDLALQIELNIYQLIQQGRIKDLITDEQMKKILNLLAERKKFRFIR